MGKIKISQLPAFNPANLDGSEKIAISKINTFSLTLAELAAAISGDSNVPRTEHCLIEVSVYDGWTEELCFKNTANDRKIGVRFDYDFTSIDNSTPLVIGKIYCINSYQAGDDFSNVATVISGTINENGCVFEATGDEPNSWNGNTSLKLRADDPIGSVFIDTTQDFTKRDFYTLTIDNKGNIWKRPNTEEVITLGTFTANDIGALAASSVVSIDLLNPAPTDYYIDELFFNVTEIFDTNVLTALDKVVITCNPNYDNNRGVIDENVLSYLVEQNSFGTTKFISQAKNLLPLGAPNGRVSVYFLFDKGSGEVNPQITSVTGSVTIKAIFKMIHS